jgi:hypothetical protein
MEYGQVLDYMLAVAKKNSAALFTLIGSMAKARILMCGTVIACGMR